MLDNLNIKLDPSGPFSIQIMEPNLVSCQDTKEHGEKTEGGGEDKIRHKRRNKLCVTRLCSRLFGVSCSDLVCWGCEVLLDWSYREEGRKLVAVEVVAAHQQMA